MIAGLETSVKRNRFKLEKHLAIQKIIQSKSIVTTGEHIQ